MRKSQNTAPVSVWLKYYDHCKSLGYRLMENLYFVTPVERYQYLNSRTSVYGTFVAFQFTKSMVLLSLFDHQTAFVSGRFWKRSSGTKTCVCIPGPRQTSDSGTVPSARLGGLVCRSCRTRCHRVWVGPPAKTKNDGWINEYTKLLLNYLVFYFIFRNSTH